MSGEMTEPREALAALLKEEGFEPDFNVCASCLHHGSQHDGGNWCLICPRPDVPARPIDGRLNAGWCYFSSMDEAEKWAHGTDRLIAAGVTLVPSLDEGLLGKAVVAHRVKFWASEPCVENCGPDIATEYRRLAQEGETP